jgi:hypothetical protein
MNADAQKRGEFAKPEDRPGWVVVEFPLQSKK